MLLDTKADIVIDKLDETFRRFGSDNRPQFKAEKYCKYIESIDVKPVRTTTKWANGEVE